MEKYMHFEVVLKTVEKIRKELDELQGWIHSEMFDMTKSGRKEPMRGRRRQSHHGHSHGRHSHSQSQRPPVVEDLDTSNDNNDYMQVDVNPYVKNEIPDDDYGGVGDEELDNDQMTDYDDDNDNDNYQDPDYAPTASDHRRQNVPAKKSRMTKPSPTYIEKPLSLPKPKVVPPQIKNFTTAKFIKSNSPKAECFVMVVDGFTYHKNKSGKTTHRWQCSDKRFLCKASAVTTGPIGENEVPEILKVDIDEHYHPANPTKLKLKEAIMDAKMAAMEDPNFSKEVFTEMLAKNLLPEELALAPKFSSIKRSIYRDRNKSLTNMPPFEDI